MPDRKPLKCRVIVFNTDGSVLREHTNVEIARSGNKAWLMNAIVWATNNGKCFEVFNECDANEYEPAKT